MVIEAVKKNRNSLEELIRSGFHGIIVVNQQPGRWKRNIPLLGVERSEIASIKQADTS